MHIYAQFRAETRYMRAKRLQVVDAKGNLIMLLQTNGRSGH